MLKVLLANPPVVRSANSTPANDFKIDHFVPNKWMAHSLLARRAIDFLKVRFGLGKGVRYGVRAGSRWPWTIDSFLTEGGPPYPFFMGYTAGLLRAHGHDAQIRDAVAEAQYNYEEFLADIKAYAPDIVILECTTPTLDIDLWFAEKVSKFSEVALAGSHLTSKCDEVVRQSPWASYFLKGEYILSALDMVTSRRKGIYESNVVKKIDDIPFPVRDYPSASRYYDPTMPTARPQLQIYGSKGCPFKCAFCLWPQTMYAGHVSLRSPQKIAEEIRQNVEEYGYKSIFFDDDTFNLGTERISELCDELHTIGLPWSMMGRLDCSPNWLFDKMIDSGCVGMRFGVETFNKEVLARVHKGIERTDFQQTLEHLAASYHDIMIHVTMMRDLPGQTEEMHQQDMSILKALHFSEFDMRRSYQLSRCVPFPGTRLYDEIREQLSGVDDDFRKYDGSQATVLTNARESQ
ncbi:MAG: radical SAM protein [Desulfovibrio desulfuricans]|nr:radical SAM protein [Desulfovibrio desulfuricans]